jgi:hypothetical protein
MAAEQSARTPGDAEAPRPEGERDDVVERTRQLAEGLLAIVGDTARLLAVDARLCASTALTMVLLALAASLLAVATWLLANAGIALLLVRLDVFTPASAFLAVAALNLIAALLLALRLRAIARDLTFRHSRAAIGSLVAAGGNTAADHRRSDEPCSPAAD